MRARVQALNEKNSCTPTHLHAYTPTRKLKGGEEDAMANRCDAGNGSNEPCSRSNSTLVRFVFSGRQHATDKPQNSNFCSLVPRPSPLVPDRSSPQRHSDDSLGDRSATGWIRACRRFGWDGRLEAGCVHCPIHRQHAEAFRHQC